LLLELAGILGGMGALAAGGHLNSYANKLFFYLLL
jgi:hypothetical protein